MPKFSIYLLTLLSFYCYGMQIFKPTSSKDKVNEQNVKLGEEFIVEFITDYISEPLTFLNKDEVSDSIQVLRIEAHPLRKSGYQRFFGRSYKVHLYFKAIKVTNEAKILKFHNKPRGEKNFINYIIKVNVY